MIGHSKLWCPIKISGLEELRSGWKGRGADLEKAASGARGHFVGNNAILRTFCSKYTVCFIEDEKGRVEDRELRMDKRDFS